MKPPVQSPSLEDNPSEPVIPQQVHEYRIMVKDKLTDAIESTIYMCGMVVLDLDAPCFDIFHCEPSLAECDTHVESDFYV